MSGLEGSGLALRNNGADDLYVGENGAFAFSAPVDDGAYALILQPDGKIVGAGRSRAGGTNDFALARYWP